MQTMTDLLAHFNTRLEDMVTLLTTLVEHESPTTDKPSVDRLGERLAEELKTLDAQVERHARDEVGDVWVARWNAGATGKPLTFISHIDTVWDVGTLAERPVRRDGEGRLYGPGAFDMKGGITAGLFAVRELRALGLMPDTGAYALHHRRRDGQHPFA
jgi:glutamate carboxypeptidase